MAKSERTALLSSAYASNNRGLGLRTCYGQGRHVVILYIGHFHERCLRTSKRIASWWMTPIAYELHYARIANCKWSIVRHGFDISRCVI